MRSSEPDDEAERDAELHSEDPPSDATKLRSSQAMAVAWNLGWPIAAGVILGAWLDSLLGTAPLATLVCTLGALAASVRWLIALTKRNGGSDD